MISVVVPVYNRPGEVEELLESLALQDKRDFEVVIVEDGSRLSSREVVTRYVDSLNIVYYEKPNSGPGPSRNYGAKRASGDFLIFLDSDCIVPIGYMEVVEHAIESGVRMFGGPDMAAESFSSLQKAVSYSMTSFFTTGGIRGGKKKLDRFIPRSFNMGIAKDVFLSIGGFSAMRFGEDIDISMRAIESGVEPVLLSEAGVYHKRRTRMEAFFRQVYFSGIARVNLSIRHRGSLKLVHLLPSFFVLLSLACLVAAGFYYWTLVPLLLLALVWFTDSSVRNRSTRVGALSVCTSFIQLFGYGCGFITGLWRRFVLQQSEEQSCRTGFF